MTLKEVIGFKNQIRVKEYERLGDALVFIGGVYYADGKLIPIDGGFYTLGMETKLIAWEWLDDSTLMLVRERT